MGCCSSVSADDCLEGVVATRVVNLALCPRMTDNDASDLSLQLRHVRPAPTAIHTPSWPRPHATLSGAGLKTLCNAASSSLRELFIFEAAVPKVELDAVAEAIGLLPRLEKVLLCGVSLPRTALVRLASMKLRGCAVKSVVLGGLGVDRSALLALSNVFPQMSELGLMDLSSAVDWRALFTLLREAGVELSTVSKAALPHFFDQATVTAFRSLCPVLDLIVTDELLPCMFDSHNNKLSPALSHSQKRTPSSCGAMGEHSASTSLTGQSRSSMRLTASRHYGTSSDAVNPLTSPGRLQSPRLRECGSSRAGATLRVETDDSGYVVSSDQILFASRQSTSQRHLSDLQSRHSAREETPFDASSRLPPRRRDHEMSTRHNKGEGSNATTSGTGPGAGEVHTADFFTLPAAQSRAAGRTSPATLIPVVVPLPPPQSEVAGADGGRGGGRVLATLALAPHTPRRSRSAAGRSDCSLGATPENVSYAKSSLGSLSRGAPDVSTAEQSAGGVSRQAIMAAGGALPSFELFKESCPWSTGAGGASETGTELDAVPTTHSLSEKKVSSNRPRDLHVRRQTPPGRLPPPLQQFRIPVTPTSLGIAPHPAEPSASTAACDSRVPNGQFLASPRPPRSAPERSLPATGTPLSPEPAVETHFQPPLAIEPLNGVEVAGHGMKKQAAPVKSNEAAARPRDALSLSNPPHEFDDCPSKVQRAEAHLRQRGEKAEAESGEHAHIVSWMNACVEAFTKGPVPVSPPSGYCWRGSGRWESDDK